MNTDLSSIEPFEIAFIRPPTENQSLAFRLTRNCYWNHCAFCPVYKFGPRFSKRSFEAIQNDIQHTAALDRLLDAQMDWDADLFPPSDRDLYQKSAQLIQQINAARQQAGREPSPAEQPDKSVTDDPILSWFLQWVKDTPTIEDAVNHLLFWRMAGKKHCFLGDADALILKPSFIDQVISEIKKKFPSIDRFTVYGRTASAARSRSLDDLKAYRSSGLDRVHFGIESGADRVLKFMKKGETRTDHIEGCQKTKSAGLSCSVYVMPGLGGVEWSTEHATETASVLTEIEPDYIRLRSLEIFPQTPLAQARDNGNFSEADEDRVVEEIRTMVSEIQGNTILLSDSASNLLDINGRLPADRETMLDRIDAYLNMPERERRLYSLKSRLNAFEGQYGGLSQDLYEALRPYIHGGRLDLDKISSDEAQRITRQIRAKLMP